jgi:hypothetical protein
MLETKGRVMFDRNTAQLAIQELKKANIEVGPGLSSQEIDAIEAVFEAKLPPDLSSLLSEGVPVRTPGGRYFPDWHHDPRQILADSRDYLENAFTFDIEENEYWHPSFGDKPDNIEQAKKQAITVIKKLPPLIPVFLHRYMPSQPSESYLCMASC